MKKYIKILIIFFILIIAFWLCFNNKSYSEFNFEQAINDARDADGIESTKSAAKNIVGPAIQIVRIFAAGIAVIMLLVLSIKYMSAAPEGKAEIKKSALYYVIGATVMFGTSGILGLLNDIASNIK